MMRWGPKIATRPLSVMVDLNDLSSFGQVVHHDRFAA